MGIHYIADTPCTIDGCGRTGNETPPSLNMLINDRREGNFVLCERHWRILYNRLFVYADRRDVPLLQDLAKLTNDEIKRHCR